MNWFKELTSGKLEYKTTGDLQKDRELEENYIKAFNDAIEIANSTDKGRILINKWKNISHKPTMVEAELVREYNKSNPNNGVEKKKWNTRYDPASNKIYWSPRISLILTNINRTEIISFTSPASILLHEAFHLTDEKLLTHLMMNHPLYRDEAEHYAVTHTNEIRRELGETERFYYISNKGQRETKDSVGASNAFYNDNGNRVEVKINIITEESSSNVRIRKTTIDRHFFDRNLVEIKTIRFVGEKDYNNNLIKTFEKVLEPNVGQVIDEDYISGVKKIIIQKYDDKNSHTIEKISKYKQEKNGKYNFENLNLIDDTKIIMVDGEGKLEGSERSNETLISGDGRDELEGGNGYDTYVIKGQDTIYDTDNSGKIFFNEETEANRVHYFVYDEDKKEWHSSDANGKRDKKYIAHRDPSSNSLKITKVGSKDSVEIKDYFRNGNDKLDGSLDLKVIEEKKEDPKPPKPEDIKWDYDHSDRNVVYSYDANAASAGARVRGSNLLSSQFLGSRFDDVFVTGDGGLHLVNTFYGKDEVIGGAGTEFIRAGGNQYQQPDAQGKTGDDDTVSGGGNTDIIASGGGNDTLWADVRDSYAYTILCVSTRMTGVVTGLAVSSITTPFMAATGKICSLVVRVTTPFPAVQPVILFLATPIISLPSVREWLFWHFGESCYENDGRVPGGTRLEYASEYPFRAA